MKECGNWEDCELVHELMSKLNTGEDKKDAKEGRNKLIDRIFRNDVIDIPNCKKSSVWKGNCEPAAEDKKCEVEEGGSYYVFNPNKDKPRKIYDNYKEALADCKKVAEIAQEKVLVLKVVAEAEIHKMIYVKERGLNNGQIRNI